VKKEEILENLERDFKKIFTVFTKKSAGGSPNDRRRRIFL